MKRHFVIFLVLIICAAMVGSSTLVIVLNMPVIAQASQKIQADAEQPDTSNQAPEKTASHQSGETTKAVAMAVSSQQAAPISGEFTPAEREQIALMLNDLGVQDKDISNDTIKNFQNQNSLSPTGNIDTNTLNEIIRQLALVKAQAAVGT